MFVNRLTRAGAVALAVAAVAAPTAVAMPIDGPAAEYKLPQGFQTADHADANPTQDFRNPDTVDYADGRGTYNAPEVVVVKAPETAPAPTGDGMDWADAGLGAGTVMGLSLVALGGGLLIVRRRGAGQLAS